MAGRCRLPTHDFNVGDHYGANVEIREEVRADNCAEIWKLGPVKVRL